MKKLSAILLCILVFITCSFAGCAGFAINKVKYYNDVLATVGDKNITRFELLTAYNNYGYNYYANQLGESEEKALNSTLDLLINREALYQYGKNKEEFKPTAYQINKGIEELFTSLDSEMKSYVVKAKNIFNISLDEEETDTEKDETPYLKSDYVVTNENRRAFVRAKYTYYLDATKEQVTENETDYFDVNYYIEYNNDLLKEPQSYEKVLGEENNAYLTDFTNKNIYTVLKNTYLTRFLKSLSDEKDANLIYNKVLSLLADNLMDYEYYLRDENGKAYSKNTDDLLLRYFERTFTSKVKEIYLDNIRTNYLVKEVSSFNIEDLEESFNYLYTSSRNKYINNDTKYKNAMKNAGTDADDILYHNNLEDGTQFGYFIHTLLSFDETTKTRITNLDKLKPIDSEEYKSSYNAIIADVEISVRDKDTGLILEKKETLSQVMDYYRNNVLIHTNYEDRLNSFIDFMFRYSGDTATLSQGMPYVVGNNGNSAMETAFTDECLKLMEQEIGSMSETTDCVSSYGIHLVFYVNDVKAYDLNNPEAAYIATENLSYNDNNLYTTVLNPLTGQTYFDMLFDKVYPSSGDEIYSSNTGYDEYEKELINTIKVHRYSDIIKNTKSKL